MTRASRRRARVVIRTSARNLPGSCTTCVCADRARARRGTAALILSAIDKSLRRFALEDTGLDVHERAELLDALDRAVFAPPLEALRLRPYKPITARPSEASEGARDSAANTSPMTSRLSQISAGAIIASITLINTVSYSSLLVGANLASAMPMVISSALVTTAISAIIVARWNSLPFAIGGPAGNASSVIGVALVAISTHALGSKSLLADIAVTLVLSALLSGIALVLLGRLRLGRAIRYVPYPVVAGFIAGTGWLLITGSVRVVGMGWPLVALAVFATVLYVANLRWNSPLVLPLAVGGGILVAYGMLAATHTSLESARVAGWFYGNFAPSGPPFPTPALLASVDWPIVIAQSGAFAAVVIVIVLMSMFSGAGLEVASGQDARLDNDLWIAGVANILSGLAGGFGGCLVLSSSTLNYKLADSSRLPGYITGGVAFAALFGASAAVAFLPKPIFAAVVAYLGARFLVQYLYSGLKSLNRFDALIVIAMLLTTAFAGFTIALGLGILTSCAIFIATCSRYSVLRSEFSGRTMHSRVERTRRERALLDEHGERIRVLRLQGRLFFGSANALYEIVRKRIDSGPAFESIILDFTHVDGIDTSASFSFQKLRRDAERANATLLFSSLRPAFSEELERRGVISVAHEQCYEDLEDALEACEDTLLAGLEPAESGVEHTRARLLDALDEIAADETFLGYLQMREIAASTHLFSAGDRSDALFFVRDGRLSVTLGGVHLRTLHPGTLIGEMGFYSGESRMATVTALNAAVVDALSHDDFERMAREEPLLFANFHRAIVRLQGERLRMANAEVAALHL